MSKLFLVASAMMSIYKMTLETNYCLAFLCIKYTLNSISLVDNYENQNV